ncbi:hypothetical protein [Sediminicurvatus halobius]|uniref:Uncharacterized protein n=1 Tax=Sediminicurvatus halobius TaxID=2182432 RepID=A0A2U2MYD5_9GAMM|nr:hypothetical protein [Spiribacter halobius]PWG61739.1 hypothetical protein DEM34_14835 [Spiribacter halobius]UEX76831.1 hypothetical protein LMH63_12785 [Spiribacter halobius]
MEHPFSTLSPTGRRITVLAELRKQPATTVQLRELLEIERDTTAATQLNGTLQELQRAGDIEGERLPGGPHKRWSVTGLGAARQDSESDRVSIEESSAPADKPQAATVRQTTPGCGMPTPDWQPPENWDQPAGRIRELAPELNPTVTPDRVGMTADGHLLIWLPGKALPLELCQRTTAGIARLTELNRPLIRED